ncbi:MAG TPA: N-acetyltransferase [Candidatus Sumerlaeota bacterium]|nr:N-acetyltransferase [Candidatus Sumerlaeota bacterium]
MSEAPQPDPVATGQIEPRATIRFRPATVEDIDAIHGLIDEASRTTTVLPRKRENICEKLRDFLVGERDGRIIACGALALFSPVLAEIRSLVVAPDCRGQGAGVQLVGALLAEVRRIGLHRVFALTDNPPFFERSGFRVVDKHTLPQKVWTDCINCPLYLSCTEEAVEIRL